MKFEILNARDWCTEREETNKKIIELNTIEELIEWQESTGQAIIIGFLEKTEPRKIIVYDDYIE